jgi:DNA-binding response OmpR family regulator
MNSINILWADDEIDLLKPQMLFLKEKGYTVHPVTNGTDAVKACKEQQFDVVFLDESMPGLSGLQALMEIKAIDNNLPIVMITKNEAEDIMEEAIGSQIADYLIKPVKPNQILLTLKKIIDNKRLVSAKTTSDYQKEFQKIFATIQDSSSHTDWAEIYKTLVRWELDLGKSDTGEMANVLQMQKQEANTEFNKFVIKNYVKWLSKPDESTPIMSHNLLAKKVFPKLNKEVPTFLVVIDNLRLDQWKIIQPLVNEYFRFQEEETFYSILPTATQYARNAIFAGMLPLDIQKKFPDKWRNDDDEGGKNLFESDFLKDNIKRTVHADIKCEYIKITNHSDGKQMEDNILNYLKNDLVVIVYNFVDMLSHARTEMEVLKELASDEAAYRSLTLSWFDHSPLLNALKKLADKKVNIIFTTDHGTIRVKTPSKIIADRNTTTNIRYKNGRNLNYEPKDVFEIKRPIDAFLPAPNVSTTYVFAKEDTYLVYPNNYNHFVTFFKNTFQHGGISLEEMIVPLAFYTSK